jgi:beta-phosphoglucomutase-like phosphatase (HAD superfamily)
LKENNILIAVASSSDKAVIERYLKLESLEGLFDAIISGDMVAHGKPNPEVFLKACEELKVSPKDAVVLEDSVVGVKASKNAGIDVFLIRDDIYDLPIYEGKIKIRKPIVLEEEIPTKEFKSLFEVKQYLED